MARAVTWQAPLPIALAIIAGVSGGACNRAAERASDSSERATRAATEPEAPTPAERAQPEAEAPAAVEPARPVQDTEETLVVDDVRLSLRDCELVIERAGGERSQQKLPLPGDCEFARKTDGAVQVESTDHGSVVLVVASHPLPGRPGDCDTRVRALVVRSKAVRVSSDEQTIRSCGAQGPFDTMMFHVLAASASSTAR